MTMDEKGYIQYEIDWTPAQPPNRMVVEDLIHWRNRLFDVNLIGVDGYGVGFGNISKRSEGCAFWISGTQTGHLPELGPEHFCLVTDHDLAANRIRCEGPMKASSEALSHAILYDVGPSVGAVVHVHAGAAWQRLFGELPTTDAVAEAGTVRMAQEIGRLFEASDLRRPGALVMGGHRDGLISFGRDLEEAASTIIHFCIND